MNFVASSNEDVASCPSSPASCDVLLSRFAFPEEMEALLWVVSLTFLPFHHLLF